MKRWEVWILGTSQGHSPSPGLTSLWSLPSLPGSLEPVGKFHSFTQQIVRPGCARCWSHRPVSVPPQGDFQPPTLHPSCHCWGSERPRIKDARE